MTAALVSPRWTRTTPHRTLVWVALRVISGLAAPTVAGAQSPYADSVQAIPCATVVDRARRATPSAQDIWNAFRCRGDRDAVAVALWQQPLVDVRLLDTFRAAVPGSANMVALMVEAAQTDPVIERRFTALGVLARFVEPGFVVSPTDAQRLWRDAREGLSFSPRVVDHPGSPEPRWGPVALEQLDLLAQHAADEQVRAVSKGVRRLFDVWQGRRQRDPGAPRHRDA